MKCCGGPLEVSVPLSDQEDRRAAVFTEDHAFVWASAGTGKTHTLTLRALVLVWRFGREGIFATERRERIRSAREAVRRVVLTTFTRKAAAEMQTRLYRYLDLFVQSESLEEICRDPLVRDDRLFKEVAESFLESTPGRSFEKLHRGAEALSEVASELQVSTLHSFAAGLLSRHPVEAGLPVGCRFAREDEDQPADLEDQLLERWWQTVALQDDDVQTWLDSVLDEAPLQDIKAWFQLAFEHRWIPDRVRIESPVPEGEVTELLQSLGMLADLLTTLSGSKLQRTGERLCSLLGEGTQTSWSALCRFLIDNESYLFHARVKTLEKSIATMPPATLKYLDDFDAAYAVALRNALGIEKGRVWESWLHLLKRFLEWAEDAGARELGLLTFDDMIRLSVRLLADNPAVRRLERERLGALLVDEFQDTDPLQLELLRLLLQKPQDSSHEVLGFFVGDDKQSIYRFRGADVDAVVGFCRRYEELTRCRRPRHEFRLRTSFRSDPRVLDFVNGFFVQPLQLAGGDALLQPFRKAGADPPDWFVLEGTGPDGCMSAMEAREAAAQAVFQIIRQHLEEGRPYRDFLVLARDGWELNALLPVLSRAGIPVVSLGTKTFFRQPEVLDTLNLLIALHHPHDSLAIAAVLRSPLILLDDQTVDRLIRQFGAGDVLFGDRDLPEYVPSVPTRRIEQLRELARNRMKMDLTRWLAEVRHLIPMFAYLDPKDFEGRAMARIDRVLSGFRQECLAGGTTPLTWLWTQRKRADRADAWDSQLGEDVALADETIDAVRVMTIHKAKGLEGRVVIVVDWGGLLHSCFSARRGRGNGGSCLEQTDTAGRPIRELTLPWGPIVIRTPGYCGATHREQEFSLQEARRLAYVAATRARDRLVLLHPLKRSTRPLVEHLENALAAGLVRGGRPQGGQTELPLSSPLPSTFDASTYRRVWEARLAQDGPSERKLLVTPTAPMLGRPESEDGELPEYASERRGRSKEEGLAIGRLVHSYLERATTFVDFDRELMDAVVCGAELGSASIAGREATRILEGFFAGELSDGSGRSLVERARLGRIRGREVPVYLQKDGRHWHGVIDLVLEEEDRLVGVDYKTGQPADPLPESYVRQQEIYTAALERIAPGRPVSFEFWWLT